MTVMIRVSELTRQRVNSLTEQTQQTADQVISEALDALDWDRRRAQMRRDSIEARNDPDDLAEMRAVAEDMDHLRAW